MPRLVPPTDEVIAQAARLLREGQILAVTTETVYGLGADTFTVSAIERVYQLKGRPARNHLIGQVLDRQDKLEWAPTALVSRDTLLRLSPSDVHYQRMKRSVASGPWLSGDMALLAWLGARAGERCLPP